MKKLCCAGIAKQEFQPRSGITARLELHEMRIPVTRRKLDEAQSVAVRVQPHRLGVNGDHRPKFDAFG